jgi:hypothetical protein
MGLDFMEESIAASRAGNQPSTSSGRSNHLLNVYVYTGKRSVLQLENVSRKLATATFAITKILLFLDSPCSQ